MWSKMIVIKTDAATEYVVFGDRAFLEAASEAMAAAARGDKPEPIESPDATGGGLLRWRVDGLPEG